MMRWIWVGLAVVVVVVGGIGIVLMCKMQAAGRRIAVGRTTTFVSGPVDRWGYVDYVAAVNEEFSAGVTHENNAAVVLMKGTGCGGVMAGDRAAFLKVLGVKAGEVPEKGFVTLEEVATKREGEATGDRQDRLYDEERLRRRKPWRAEEDADAAAWVKGNAGALVWVEEASRRPRMYEPLIDPDGMGCILDVRMPGLGSKRALGEVLAARAMMRLGQGDRAGWRADVMTLMRYGRLLMQGQTLIQRLVGLAVESEAQECAWAGLEGMSVEEARGMLAEVRGMAAVPTLGEAVDDVERLLPLSEMSAYAKYGKDYRGGRSSGVAPVLGGSLGDPIEPANFGRWMGESNRVWDLEVRAMREKTLAGMKGAFATADADGRKMAAGGSVMTGGVDLALRKMAALFLPSFLKAAELEHAGEMQRELTEVGLLLAMDRAGRGRYAERLEDVRGAAVLEEDFFSGGKLVYRREGAGYVVYSVGLNERDDGGVWGDQAASGKAVDRRDDIVVRVGK